MNRINECVVKSIILLTQQLFYTPKTSFCPNTLDCNKETIQETGTSRNYIQKHAEGGNITRVQQPPQQIHSLKAARGEGGVKIIRVVKKQCIQNKIKQG